ncbi:MAG: hypothetical protein ACPGVG_10240 [Mycobacterium sp.]
MTNDLSTTRDNFSSIIESLALFIGVVEQSVVAIWACDRDGAIAIVNREAQRLAGAPLGPADWVIARFEVRAHPDGPELAVEDMPLVRSLRDRETIEGGTLHITTRWRPDGYWVEIERSQPIYRGETLVGAACYFREIEASDHA